MKSMKLVKRPNLLVFLTDQQRWDTCGCYGQPLDTTPNLDRLAASGVRFEHAFTCQPVCGPVRATLQTGRYPASIGCFHNGIALPQEADTLAKRLSRTGYATGYIGKWHLASERSEGAAGDFRARPVPLERRGGFHEFWMAADSLESTSHAYDGHLFDHDMNRVEFLPSRYRADVLADHAIEFLERPHERPFLLFVSQLEPHHQNDHRRYEGPHGSRERFRDFVPPGDLVETGGDWRAEYPDYLGCVNRLDYNLGRILDALDARGLRRNTVVVFTSDHGSHFRTRNAEYKCSCHEASTRIPLVMAGPGFEPGRVVRELVSLIHLPPTLLDLAGLAAPDDMHGSSLLPLTRGEAELWRNEVFLQISTFQVGRALRTDRWKYSVSAPGKDPHTESGSDRYVEEFLYDLQVDPHERDNRVRDPALQTLRASLADRLKQAMRRAGEAVPEILPAPPEERSEPAGTPSAAERIERRPAQTVPPLPSRAGGNPRKVNWAQAARSAPWRTLHGNPTHRDIDARFAHDHEFLYLRLRESGIASNRLESDSAVFGGDRWELLFAPQRGPAFRQLGVNPDGAIRTHAYSEYSRDWESGATAISVLDPDCWTVWLATPLDRLLPGGCLPGRRLFVNLLRGGRESLAWSPTYADKFLRAPESLGEILLVNKPGIERPHPNTLTEGDSSPTPPQEQTP